MKNKKTLKFDGENLVLLKSKYANNDALYVGLYTTDGEDYADVSINIDGVSENLQENCVVLSHNISGKLKKMLYDAFIVEELGNIQYGFAQSVIVKLNLDGVEDLEEFEF